MLKKMLLFLCVALLIFPAVVLSRADAAQYEIKEMTPAVKAALEGRRDRYEQLSVLKVQGLVGENNRGYTEALGGGQDVAAVVAAENRDRKVIYETIVKQNGLTGALGTIEKVFAQEQRARAAAGMKVQNEDGAWVTK